MEIQPLPNTGMTKILGLCEALDDRGGRDDVYRLARDLQLKFGELVLTIKGGEALRLLSTPGADVMLEPLGKKVIEVKMNEKKAILREQLKQLGLFQHFVQLLQQQPERSLPKDAVIEEIAKALPHENTTQTFNTLLNWGRYGEIFNFSRDTNTFALDSDYGKTSIASP